MSRREELLKIFKDLDENVLTIVTPMVDELIFVEGQLVELKKMPFVRVHPDDISKQKSTAAYKVYKDLLAQQKDIVRILCSQLHKGGEGEADSKFDAYLKMVAGP